MRRRHYQKNKVRLNEIRKTRRAKNKGYWDIYNWKRTGKPIPDYPRTTTCELCGDPPNYRSLHLDHDHKTGKFRGWLCSKCNQGLGLFKDNPELLMKAVEYLKRGNIDKAEQARKNGTGRTEGRNPKIPVPPIPG